MVGRARPDRPGHDRVASIAVAVQAWFEQGESPIRPGETQRLALTIENLDETTESMTVIPAGPTATWITVDRPNPTLFGQSRDTVEILVRPPATHTTSAGAAALAVRVVPLGAPDDTVTAETTLQVQEFDHRRVSMLQPLQRARRRAVFEFMVENHGNTLASCRLHLVDPSNRLDGSFDPPAVGVAPGASSLVRLKVHATGARFRRHDRQLDFGIEATQTDHEPAIARGSLVQPPTVPTRVIGQVVLLAAVVAAAVGAWFGVVRPELRDAARDAVDDRIAELGTTGDGPGARPVSDPTTDEPEPEGPEPAGPDDVTADGSVSPAPADGAQEFAVRLPLQISVGGTNSDSAAVPSDARLLLTDVVLQNPGRDLGTAALLRNSDVLYEWDLGAMNAANEFQPRVTPFPFAPGDEIVFRATCDGAGSVTAAECDVAVLLAGRLVPPD
jgi:hypothetical protein